jgi:hypothetical protein
MHYPGNLHDPGRANHGSNDTSFTQRRALGGVDAQPVLGSLTGAAAQTTFPQLGAPTQAARYLDG